MERLFIIIIISSLALISLPANAELQYPLGRDSVPPASDTTRINTYNLEEVVVRGLGKKTSNVAGAQTIKLGELPVISLNMAENMSLSSGIKVRQNGGGLGTETNIVMNSYSGKSVRGYIDWIPVEFMGYALGAAPALFFENVEIYRGFAPDNISSDFLGGAINYSMRNTYLDNYLKLSYEVGSWNTHRAAVRIKKTFKDFYAGFDAFGAYAKNDYAISVSLNTQEEANYTLFNNRFQQAYIGAFVGISNRKWADDIRLGGTLYNIRKGIPHNANMTMPYGKVENHKTGDFIFDLRYKKHWENLYLSQTLGYAHISTQYIDTLRGSYQWDGTFQSNANLVGESIYGGSWAKKTNRNFFSQTNIKTFLNDNNYLFFNLNLYNFHSKGKDDYAPKSPLDNKTDLLSYPAKYTKAFSSLGWGFSAFQRKIKNTFSVKLFLLGTEGYKLDPLTALLLPDIKRNTFNRLGLQNIASFNITKNSKIKLGLNFTSRLPDLEEIYGDYSTILSNFSLKPENTKNITAGYEVSSEHLSLSTNLWYRDTRDIVQMEQVNNYWTYVNIGDVAGYGFDLYCSYNPTKAVKLWGNCMYNNVRYKRLEPKYGANLIDSRLRNTPFLQSNMGINIRLKRFSFDCIYTWVNSYYFTFIPKKYEKSGWAGFIGKTSYDEDPYSIIPDQHVCTLGIGYIDFLTRGLSLAVNVKNVLDAKVFDNYRVQNAGRTFVLKITYNINHL